MNINEITFEQAKELINMFSGNIVGHTGNNQLSENGEKIIAVLQRGNIVVGEYSQDGEIGTVSGCSVVRKWGTTSGLGELAEKGPLENTKLDKCPDVSFHIREVVMVMRCTDAWR